MARRKFGLLFVGIRHALLLRDKMAAFKNPLESNPRIGYT